ncbi:hypothetical protein [Arthrobacter sp. C9C5]|uniref:TIR domain-containing protein n=1 Tax=Arthrobacter sp. C9C5 TaxID=2735267 RepID=UPI0015848D2B|nr:hypothetical protein [Arthrobacter sp. C9C5]NUU30132.1 hypothetical protein [Arthrobacter sp. C9C5]
MRVFLSWSKDLSRETAKLFAKWLPNVIQECSEPFLSLDIGKGDPWFETITTNLTTTDLGIVFITAENQHEPWLNFEAGAMLNKFGKAGICPVLVGLSKEDYAGPLSNLQLTEIKSEEDMRGLLGTINRRCKTPLAPEVLGTIFDAFWPKLMDGAQTTLATVEAAAGDAKSKRTVEQKVDEILNLVRGITSDPRSGDMEKWIEAEAKQAELGRSRRFEYFAKKYGSMHVYRNIDKAVGKVLEFSEKEGKLQYVVALFSDDPEGRVYLAEDVELCPF